ncbi:MAG: glycosyltransferase family 4 protein [Actinomycetota bacterium]|nr:glycosyltransferase family 4 protein [Actinomycetota bacterium]
MRIVFLCDQYPPIVWDGAGTYTHAAAHALAALGHDVHVVACEGRRWSEAVDGGVSVHRRPALTLPVTKLLGPFRRLVVGAHAPRDSLSIRASLAVSYAFWMHRLDLQPDLVETQDGETRGLWFAMRRSVPLVIYLHTPTMLDVRLMGPPLSLRGRLADRIDRLSSDRADVLTSPSQLLVDTLRQFGWLEGKEPQVIPPPAPRGPWAEVPSALSTDPVVLTAGRQEWRKGGDVLVDALPRLRGIEGVEALFAGTSSGRVGGRPYEEWLGARADAVGARCRFLGPVPQAAMADLYARSRVVAIPSRYENFSTVAVEAMASGRPVVCSSTGGIAPLVERWGAGTVVPPEDPAALGDALEPFLESPQVAAEAGERGRIGVRSELDPEMVARRREAVYREAIENHARYRSEGTRVAAASG